MNSSHRWRNPNGNPPINTAFIDLWIGFNLYLVARFADNSMYPVAATSWWVNFYSNYSNVLDPNGVHWYGSFGRTNDRPLALDFPIYNGNVTWR